MRKLNLFVLFASIALLLSACGGKEKDEKEVTRAEISSEVIAQTVADIKTHGNVTDASFNVDGDEIDMKLVVEGVSSSNKDVAREYADSFLRTISVYDKDNKPTKDSYGKIYEGYYVNVVVEDPNGMQAIEGNMYPGINSITWE